MRHKVGSLALVTAAVLVLAGCGAPQEVVDDLAASGAGECVSPFQLEGSEFSDAVSVAGTGVDAKPTIDSAITIGAPQTTILKRGTGEILQANDFVNVEYVITDASTGEILETSRTSSQDFRTAKLDSQHSIFSAQLICAPGGTESVLTIPADSTGSGTPWIVYVKAENKLPLVADGAAVTDIDPDAPTVVLDTEGRPTVIVPDTEPPTETTVQVLKEGTGREVADGDEVYFQYHLMTWDDPEPRESTYESFTPISGATNGFVPGFTKALVGNTVGSQVLVVVAPEDGYTVPGNESSEMYGETLVFVLDIVAANPPFEAGQ